MASDELLQDWRDRALRVEDEVGRAIIGQRDTIRLINVALFARGHVLLEGDVGVGKTTILRAFSRAIGGDFERVEGTVDLMPGDLIYHTYVDAEGKPRIEPGPLLRHGERLATFFFNEINRARPQVQSLLLRAMAERTVSAFNREYRFPHMIVFADRNRVEKEETFELASAARDRFMFELRMPTPDAPDIRRALVFDPEFHDVDRLIERVAPVSRLAFAHEAARRTLRDLPCGSRVGWAAFTGYRTIPLLAPVEVCANYNDLLASLDQIDGRMRWSNASEITKGVYWSVLAAQEIDLSSDVHPDVVFLSDGQEAPLLDPAYPPRVLDDLKKDSIRGWLIGVGADAPSPIPRIDEEGHRQGYWHADEVIQPTAFGNDTAPPIEHLSGLREPHLRSLADQLDFSYARLTGPTSLSEALRDPRFARRRPAPTDLFWLPASLAVLLLAMRFLPDLLQDRFQKVSDPT